jgi:hypothetical protein
VQYLKIYCGRARISWQKNNRKSNISVIYLDFPLNEVYDGHGD